MALENLVCDHFIRATPDIDEPYRICKRLGLPVKPPVPTGDTTAHYTVISLGAYPDTMMSVQYQTHYDYEAGLKRPQVADLVRLLQAGGGMRNIVFGIDDLEPARRAFADRPGGFTETATNVLDGKFQVKSLTPGDVSAAGCKFVFAEYPKALMTRAAGPEPAEFPIKRVDHIAIIPPDFEASTRFWTEVMGLRPVGELEARGVLIRQLQVGDMVIELLKAVSPDSPLAQRAPGLLPVMAVEVEDVAASVKHARARGFNPPDPAPGVLPHTLVSRISADEMCGMEWQLLQYV